jgi:hypothetical protein
LFENSRYELLRWSHLGPLYRTSPQSVFSTPAA